MARSRLPRTPHLGTVYILLIISSESEEHEQRVVMIQMTLMVRVGDQTNVFVLLVTSLVSSNVHNKNRRRR